MLNLCENGGRICEIVVYKFPGGRNQVSKQCDDFFIFTWISIYNLKVLFLGSRMCAPSLSFLKFYIKIKVKTKKLFTVIE